MQEIVKRVAAAVADVSSIDRVPIAIAQALETEIDIDRVSVRAILPVEPALMIIARWARRPTEVDVGLRMSSLASSLPELLRTGRTAITNAWSEDELLDEVLASEGIKSWATLMIRRAGRPAALLSLSSLRADGMSAVTDDFFVELAHAVEDRIVALMDASGHVQV